MYLKRYVSGRTRDARKPTNGEPDMMTVSSRERQIFTPCAHDEVPEVWGSAGDIYTQYETVAHQTR